MDTSLLHQFRQQLAIWIETRLNSQRLPFQRLELCPATLTDRGMLTPDLVLWINRDSQLAGSIILLPDIVEDRVLAEGVSLCRALGLGHFTTWAAREVSIWLVDSTQSSLLYSFPLPPANQVTPEDFQRTLDNLLGQLKVITVTSAPSTADYTVHYFVNLCLRNLQELSPGLMISARMSAGETAADKWVEHAPLEKAWISLWRILFLLWKGRLPPGLQPERLELAIHYALTDLTTGQLSWFDLQGSEPPLPEEDAVRLHHLASRLRQLGWPRNDENAEELVCLLLNESAHRFNLKAPLLPWDIGELEFWVNCQPPMSLVNGSLIAPRAYLAGWAFRTTLGRRFGDSAYAEDLQALDMGQHFTSGIAVLHEAQPLSRKERNDRLIFFRQVWPSRRFDLPGNAPAWLWDALYLAGLISEELSLILPHGWHRVPGILNLWAILEERYHLADIAEGTPEGQALRFVAAVRETTSVRVHRSDLTINIPADLLALHKPGTTQVWLKATEQTIELIRNQEMTGIAIHDTHESEAQSWGLFLFLHTRLGRYLWRLCSDQSDLPDFNMTSVAVANFGVPVPNENILSDLSVIGSPDTLVIPEQDVLEREFTSIFGAVPTLPEDSVHVISDVPKIRRRNSVPIEEIAIKVFQDGVPRFPEHYLMHIYRPALIHYDLCGPLEIEEEFFGRISLRTPGQDHIIEVSGKIVADALLLASYGGEANVSLPEDESILEELVLHYRSDLKRLWDNLVSECRRVEPHRQAAVRLARRIWQQYGLPPQNVP